MKDEGSDYLFGTMNDEKIHNHQSTSLVVGQKEHAKSMLALEKPGAGPYRHVTKKYSSREPVRKGTQQQHNDRRKPKIVYDSSVQQLNCYGRPATSQTQNGLTAYYSQQVLPKDCSSIN